MSEHAGRVVRQKNFGPIQVTEMLHPAAARLSTHSHQKPCFTLVSSGAFHERLGSADFLCDRTTSLYRPAFAPHSDVFSCAGASALLVETDASWLAAIIPKARLLSAPRSFRREATLVLASKIQHELTDPDEVSELIVVGLALQMAGQLQRSYKEERGHAIPKWLLQARDRINASFRAPPPLAEIASEVNVCPVHLAREFRRLFHCTPGQYIRELRVKKACRMLSGTRLHLVDIASNCGFSNQSHFNRVFKRIMSVSPREFRAKSQ